jgi:hypothetical protein
MELALPIVALSGLYLINNQSKRSGTSHFENFANLNHEGVLPNTDIPNRNYPEEYPVVSSDIDATSALSHNNKFDSPGVYTDKYFNEYAPNTLVNNALANSLNAVNPSTGSAKYYSLTGESVDSNYFQHNNMVPFFGSNLRNMQTALNSNESALDNMNGTGSQIFSKKEQAPMFSPHGNLQWATGAPNANDFYQSRVNPSARMANVKPFAEERVGPGLGLGYTTEGSGGFNAGMAMREQWLDKNVDELRVANKPKSSGHMLLGHEGPANSFIKMTGDSDHMGRFEKNRPETSFELGPDRLFTTMGVQQGPMLHSIPVGRDQHRADTAISYSGGAGVGPGHSAAYVPGEYMPSHNQQLGSVPIPVANAGGRHYATDADYGMKSSMAYPNNRSANNQADYYGGMGGAIGAVIAPLLDALRPSRRENTIGTLRPYQNPKSEVAQSYIFNPADRTPTTIRETTENSKFHLNVNANQNGGAYAVTEQQPANTYRQFTDDYYYAGNAGAGEGARGIRPYDAEYNQRNNDIKSSTIQGYMVQGNMKLLNGDINMQSKPKDQQLKNRRDVVPTMPFQTPGISTMGSLQGSNQLYSNIQLDRSDPAILDSLKGNPYALSVVKAF